jgi:hypothetical protein
MKAETAQTQNMKAGTILSAGKERNGNVQKAPGRTAHGPESAPLSRDELPADTQRKMNETSMKTTKRIPKLYQIDPDLPKPRWQTPWHEPRPGQPYWMRDRWMDIRAVDDTTARVLPGIKHVRFWIGPPMKESGKPGRVYSIKVEVRWADRAGRGLVDRDETKVQVPPRKHQAVHDAAVRMACDHLLTVVINRVLHGLGIATAFPTEL